ncbi:hypothetical protein IE53DRAFT_369483 [Violaceomyces palustris]|uniref:Uncharacterized protein n=1 Tax=Violaceomyces palustris TaxID=1673888 RepID=A0ACD0NVL1_9BASI|nr:hypothetical protein IE53DRAFT_369483 [Violaceomyces palustris]
MIQDLPPELQAHIVTFLPSRVLARTVARVNKHFARIVDQHVRRSVLNLLADPDHESRRKPGRSLLVFEAQRPIDTITAKHTLYFSHFGVTNSNRPTCAGSDAYYTTIAHFAFSPLALPQHADQQPLETVTEAPERDTLPHHPMANSAAPMTVRDESLPQYEDVHDNEGVDVAYIASPPGWLQPMPDDHPSWRERRIRTTNDTSLGSGLESDQEASDPSAEAGMEAFLMARSDPGQFYVSPSSASASSKAASRHPACYAIQLDPLDSFESLILTLTVKRRVENSLGVLEADQPNPTRSVAQFLRHQRIVAEGLDRVFRDWFRPPAPTDVGSSPLLGGGGGGSREEEQRLASAAALQTLMSTFGPINLLGGVGGGGGSANRTSSTSRVRARSTSSSRGYNDPPPRVLEFDSSSCTLTIQPHPTSRASASHPALSSLESHNYLSQGSLYSHYASTLHDRCELTFHCESLGINAARLLSVLEQVEIDVMAETIRNRRNRYFGAPMFLAGATSSQLIMIETVT